MKSFEHGSGKLWHGVVFESVLILFKGYLLAMFRYWSAPDIALVGIARVDE